jgi:hypothetical protein
MAQTKCFCVDRENIPFKSLQSVEWFHLAHWFDWFTSSALLCKMGTDTGTITRNIMNAKIFWLSFHISISVRYWRQRALMQAE